MGGYRVWPLGEECRDAKVFDAGDEREAVLKWAEDFTDSGNGMPKCDEEAMIILVAPDGSPFSCNLFRVSAEINYRVRS